MIRQVFIVGSPRSGTSILCEALRNGGGYRGFNEGQVLDLMGGLLRMVNDHYTKLAGVLENPAHMISVVPRERIESALIPPFRAIVRDHFGPDAWVDKTPGDPMIRAVPYLLKLWPNARVVYARRRAIENIQSRIRKFPRVPFENHCRMWATCMSAWDGVREGASASVVEIDQYEIERNPAAVTKALGDTLRLPPPRRQAIERIFIERHPEQTGKSEPAARIALADTGWNAQQIEQFRTICGPMMQRFGYSETASYYADPAVASTA